MQMKAGQYYNLLLAVNGTTVTVLVDGTKAFTYTFAPRVIDGVTVGLNKGMVGIGSDNARGIFDNVAVQVLPPQVTYDNRADLSQSTSQLDPAWSGTWQGPASAPARPAPRAPPAPSSRSASTPAAAWPARRGWPPPAR